MEKYLVTTTLGSCECYVQNGIYYPIHIDDLNTFLFEPIYNVEKLE